VADTIPSRVVVAARSLATAGGRRSSKAGSDDGKLRWSGQNPLLLRPPSAQCTTRPSGAPSGERRRRRVQITMAFRLRPRSVLGFRPDSVLGFPACSLKVVVSSDREWAGFLAGLAQPNSISQPKPFSLQADFFRLSTRPATVCSVGPQTSCIEGDSISD
jgi:hypothetical protein